MIKCYHYSIKEQKAQIVTTTIDRFIDLFPELRDADIDDITAYEGMNQSHCVFCLCIVLNLVGKKLDSTNYTAWVSRRKRSYSSPLGLTEQDSMLADLVPSPEFSAAFYENVKIFWKIRRLFFLNIFGMSSKTDLLGAGTRVVLTLLKHAEMTSWNFISYWLLEVNPELLMWNELAKYWPGIVAASAKFSSLGPFALWAKLAFPPEEVSEFSSQSLGLPYAVSRAIAEKYGNATASQIGGTMKD